MRIVIKHIIPILIFTVAISSCNRNTIELPNNSSNDPVFRLEMDVDNSILEVVAGNNDIYNHTSFDLDQDEVYTFIGMLADKDCGSECSNAYRFNFRNYETGSNNVDISKSLSLKSYSYKNEQAPTKDAVEVHVDVTTQAKEPVFNWTINDLAVSQQDIRDIFILNVEDDEKTEATLFVKDESSGLISYSSQRIQLDESVTGVSSKIIVTQIEGDSVLVELVHSEPTDFIALNQTTWAVENITGGDVFFPNGSENKFSLRIENGKTIKNFTSFFTTLGQGADTKTGIDITYDPTTDQVIYHNADFDYIIEKRIAQGSDLALQSFEFELYDESGTLYSSAKGEQSTDAYFEILEIEPYLQNKNGQETVKVTCQFSCRVFSQNGDSKLIRDANAVVAVAIP